MLKSLNIQEKNSSKTLKESGDETMVIETVDALAKDEIICSTRYIEHTRLRCEGFGKVKEAKEWANTNHAKLTF